MSSIVFFASVVHSWTMIISARMTWLFFRIVVYFWVFIWSFILIDLFYWIAWSRYLNVLNMLVTSGFKPQQMVLGYLKFSLLSNRFGGLFSVKYKTKCLNCFAKIIVFDKSVWHHLVNYSTKKIIESTIVLNE